MSNNLSLCGYSGKLPVQLDLIQTPTIVTKAAMRADHPELVYLRFLFDCEFSAEDLLKQIEKIYEFKDNHARVYWLSDDARRDWK